MPAQTCFATSALFCCVDGAMRPLAPWQAMANPELVSGEVSSLVFLPPYLLSACGPTQWSEERPILCKRKSKISAMSKPLSHPESRNRRLGLHSIWSIRLEPSAGGESHTTRCAKSAASDQTQQGIWSGNDHQNPDSHSFWDPHLLRLTILKCRSCYCRVYVWARWRTGDPHVAPWRGCTQCGGLGGEQASSQ